MAYMGKESKKSKYKYLCITDSPRYTPGTKTTWEIKYNLIKFKKHTIYIFLIRLGDTEFFMYRKQRLDMMESRLMSRKGLIKGKHTLIRPVVYTNHQLGLWKRARVILKMQDRVWKHMKVLAKSRMLWVALDSAGGLGDTLALWIYWTRWLCLYRVRIMEPLAQKMSTEHARLTSSGGNSALKIQIKKVVPTQ